MVTVTFTADVMYGQNCLIKRQGSNYDQRVYLNSDPTNCKFSYIHGAGSLQGFSKEDFKSTIDQILDKAKGCVLLNTTSPIVFNLIKEIYPVYYSHLVPIGYNNGFQYHICFKNVIRVNANCRQPNVETQGLDKPALKQKLRALLKAKRRKDDYVDEFVDTL